MRAPPDTGPAADWMRQEERSSPAILKLDPVTGAVLSRLPLPAGVASDPAIEKSLLAVALNNGEVLIRSDLP